MWAWGRIVGSALTLAVLVWRLGTGPFLDGIRTVDGGALAAAAGIAVLTTVCYAWRWKTVARGLGVDLSLPAAVAAYYRSLFLNVTLPGGIVGDVHRGVSHGRDVSDVGRALRAVAWERSAGQVVQVVADGGRSPRAAVARALVRCRVVAIAVAVAVLGIVLVARARPGGARSAWARLRSAAAGDIRDGLLARRAWPGIALASLLVVAGHAATFLIAARTAGTTAPASRMLPIVLLAMAAMVLPSVGWLGAARGRGGMGIRRGWPGCAAGSRHRRRLRRHGARRQPAGCRRPRSRMVPSYPASGADRTAAPGGCRPCLTAPTPC